MNDKSKKLLEKVGYVLLGIVIAGLIGGTAYMVRADLPFVNQLTIVAPDGSTLGNLTYGTNHTTIELNQNQTPIVIYNNTTIVQQTEIIYVTVTPKPDDNVIITPAPTGKPQPTYMPTPMPVPSETPTPTPAPVFDPPVARYTKTYVDNNTVVFHSISTGVITSSKWRDTNLDGHQQENGDLIIQKSPYNNNEKVYLTVTGPGGISEYSDYLDWREAPA